MANIYSTTSDYWIKQGALTISLNALDNPQYLQSSVLSGAVIMAFKPGVIEYDYSHNYRKWNLTAENTFFHNNEAKYVYARLDRNEDKTQALIVYASEKLDIVGRIVAEGDVEKDSLYFYIYLGSITASVNNNGDSIPRVWDDSFNFGTLATDQYIKEENQTAFDKMFRLNEVTGMIEVLKTISEATINIVRIGKKLIFGKKEITDIKRSDDSDKDVPVGDDNLTTSKYVEKDINRKALRKDKSDRTDHSLEIGKDLTVEGILKSFGDIVAKSGITVGESVIDSLLAGAGIILKDGRIQADRMELRSSLTVMELIFNRLSAMESDYSFSESGTIDSVQLLEDGTYNLPLRKRWDNDFTALAENDVVYGIVNDLASGSGNYYTSWLRVLHVDTSANTINAVMYPDSEVPGGKNYPPVPLMILSHRGNPVNEDRQGYWYLSSREKCICMLDGVRKPILEEYNYSVIVGKMKQLALFDHLPIGYRDSYIFCRGFIGQDILKVDVEGVPVVQYNERSFWTTTPSPAYSVSATIVDVVWHVGCKWLCLINGTKDEPMYGSTGWTMIEGNPEFTIDIESSAGWSLDMDDIVRLYEDGKKPFTVLNVTGKLYNGDVTSHILDGDIEWTRNTGDVTEDNAWAVAHGDTGKVLALSLNDLGPHYSTMTGCKFIARALLRDGQKMRDNTYEVEF